MATISIIGSGAWGSALANAVTRAGQHVVLYARDGATAVALAQTRINPKLPDVTLEASITVTNDLATAGRPHVILVATPAQNLRAAVQALAPHILDGTSVIACAKGIEHGTHAFMTEVIAQAAPHTLAGILSGPSFAIDVARGLPTAVTLACNSDARAEALVHMLGSPTFRPYHSSDVRGVEIGGAAKNVLAIAAGIVAGRQLGASALAALTTRGFSEMARFGRACGARNETLMGLSGLGDLVLSCAGPQSRNFSLGFKLGRGEQPDRSKLTEGEFTAPVLVELAASKAVDMPVATAVAAILSGKLSVDEAIESLLTRPFKAEGH